MNELKTFQHFHDWYIDILAVTDDGDSLTLGLKLQDRRATVKFVGTRRCVVEHFGQLNIVYDIAILQPGDRRYGEAQAALAKADRYSEKPGRHIAFVAATVGAELVVEFESLEIQAT